MQDFRITEIGKGSWHILDAGEASFYVVEGSDRAAVIDTGVSMGKKILPVIRSLTRKPLILVITHAHIDHFYHMDEFETVYMCHAEFELPEEFLREMMAGKALKLEQTIDIRTDSQIDLGDEILEICQVPGHTPGSVAVLTQKRQLLFTGDAIGSGCGVWMQVPGAVPLVQYEKSLRAFLRWLVERGGRMKFYGGHNRQQFLSALIPNYNPLNLGLLADLIDLTEQVTAGTIVGRPGNVDKVMLHEPTLYASFGRAELLFRESNIR